MTSLSHGWLILDKPLHLTSTQATSRVKRALGIKKAGHAGTLDPLASGILPIALGEATKTMPLMMNSIKQYHFTIQFGEQKSTDDSEGETIATSDKRPSEAEIGAILPKFTGTIEQIPPAFSAVHVDGKRAYERARSGETVTLQPRTVDIYELGCTDFNQEMNSASFSVRCSTGTYVRSLARDIALALDTRGFISTLQRGAVGKCTLSHAVPLEVLERSATNELSRYILPCDFMLDDIPVIEVDSALACRIRYGQTIDAGTHGLAEGSTLLLKEEGTLLAIGQIHQSMVKPERVFNL